MLALVDDPAVDLVGQDDEIVAQRELGDPDDVLAGEQAAGRVGRRVQDEHPGPLRDERLELVQVGPELVLHPDRQRHDGPAGEPGHRLVDRVAGVRDDDLVARLDEREHRVVHDRLGAGRDDDVVGADRDVLPGRDVGRDRLAERREARGTAGSGCSPSSRPRFAASRMLAGVSKSGSPISRWMTDRPVASSARARAAASKAVSVPMESMRDAIRMPGMIRA